MSAKDRIRIRRENEDRGLQTMLSTPTGRAALWWIYKQCAVRAPATMVRQDGDASALMTFRALGKQAVGYEIENRCKLVNHRDWLLLLAENDEPMDDGRAQDKRQGDAAEEGE